MAIALYVICFIIFELGDCSFSYNRRVNISEHGDCSISNNNFIISKLGDCLSKIRRFVISEHGDCSISNDSLFIVSLSLSLAIAHSVITGELIFLSMAIAQ